MANQKRTPEELSGFCAQVAMMLNSGMPLYDGMEAMAQAHEGDALAQPCAQVSRLVTQTGSLYEALKQSEGWPAYLTEMAGIGERTGKLEEVMNGLAVYYNREGGLRRAVSGAVTYPIVLGVMLLLIILVLITKVLPVFRGVLGGMGVQMTDSGNAMMRMGTAAGIAAMVVVGLLVVAAVVCVVLMRTRARDAVLRTLRSLFPPLRRVMRQLSAARAASVLSMMLSGGFPLDEALDMAPAVLDDQDTRTRLQALRQSLSEGVAMEDAIPACGLFDQLSNSMIRTACVAGCVDTVMARVAADYEQRAEEGVSRLVSVIEPVLVGVLCVVIGAILLSVMLPMAGMISSIL